MIHYVLSVQYWLNGIDQQTTESTHNNYVNQKLKQDTFIRNTERKKNPISNQSINKNRRAIIWEKSQI